MAGTRTRGFLEGLMGLFSLGEGFLECSFVEALWGWENCHVMAFFFLLLFVVLIIFHGECHWGSELFPGRGILGFFRLLTWVEKPLH